jgi:prephenate dehydrogenase
MIENSENTPSCPFSSVAVVGLGVIGASICAALVKHFPKARVCGIDTCVESCSEAGARGWVSEAYVAGTDEAEAAISECELCVIAVPVAAVKDYFELLAKVDFKGVITDTISTKACILNLAEEMLPYPQNYIPGHPMAGSEKAGIEGARIDMFEGTNWILCPDEQTVPEHYQKLHELICGIDARVVSLKREDHDSAVAVVSHVPHMVACALVELAERHADDSKSLMRLAAGGFKDTTRIAAGSPKLWCGIAFDNAGALGSGLEEMTQILQSYARAIDGNDREGLNSMLTHASNARKALPASWVPDSDALVEMRVPMVNRKGVVAEVTTIASSVGCNIQSIEIDHVSEANAVLSIILTDEGDMGQLSAQLIKAGYSFSFNPISPKEHSHVE